MTQEINYAESPLLNYVGRNINELAHVDIRSGGCNESETHTSCKCKYNEMYLITIDDIIVSQTVSSRKADVYYGEALKKMHSL